MAVNNPYQAYQQNKATTSSPGELTLMLYNGCLKFMKQAEIAIETGDVQARNVNLTKAQNIIRELMVTLKTNTELGKNMMSLYDFILNRLVEANIENSTAKIKEAEEFVISFRDTWKQAIQLDRQKRHGAQG
ncbi:flagellar export chaperone FliS [Alkalihalobacterium chitinilyticum]|uniref:Flagellar secretion chaperone FliS n=1 Tax=Alkalihalobacterium chitinilyticum TaxID=2980103 RepID=A0ABT5VF15_9BACI|nr:flagellar export chaperone FliS [Alkalihalobacterium chitinilyticum]MDE5414052.1 flagellar export chaperone FliS [Alkalihalobacterium chitinilyticum]